jgi:hypothetical protein
LENSITLNGVLFIVYLTLGVIVFWVLGGPVDTIFESMLIDPVVSQQNTFIPLYAMAARVAFAIGITTPVVWFLAKIFSREPGFVGYRRF